MEQSIIPDEVSPPIHGEIPEALREPTLAKSPLFMALYTVASMIMGVSNITIGTLLLAKHIATMVANPTDQTRIFTLIMAAGAAVAVLTCPIVGMLSDRTISRFGRRRPWYIAGAVLTVLDLLLMGSAPSLLVVAAGYIILQVTFNMLQTALAAIVPDQVPIRQRATISALSAGLGATLGALFGQALAAQYFKAIPVAYTALAVAVALMAALFLLVLRETPLSREHIEPLQVKQTLAMLKPLASRDFALIRVARCLMFLGNITLTTFLFYFLQSTKLVPDQSIAQGVQALFAVNAGSSIIASLVGGIVSDKLRRRKLFVIIASVMTTGGLALLAFFPTWTMIQIGSALVGVGFGAYLAVDFALASQVLPTAADRGKDIGIVQAAIYVPLFLSPVVAGITLSLFHSYVILFALQAIGTLIAAVLIVPIKSVR